ncbi:DUF423 domain-containing protein [Sphingomonas sp. ID0503]|uniref:DUF423 domain-containing protein n=1 Tax=Sphingomonas sp. ID0503 TaxID=3399691 RepID=UPI003AFB71D7
MLGVIAALSGAVAVIAGAFGAHAAKGDAVEWLKTGGHYQLIHAVAAILALTVVRGNLAAALFIAGGWVFGGSLYLMAAGAPRWFGAITPLGGLLLIAGWLALGWTFLRR